jgi:beta-lactamase regulating signal transducer with metallopeptidase domain
MQEFIANQFLPMLLRASWQATVLILLVLAVQWVLGQRLSPRWRSGLWLLVVVRLALPWTAPSAVSLFNFLSFSRASGAVVTARSTAGAPGPLVLQPTAVALAEMPAQPAAVAAAVAPKFSIRLSWLPLVWAAGAFALGLGLLITHYRLARRVTPCRPLIDALVMNLLEDCKQLMGVSVPVALVETAAVDGPCLFGVLRPRLLLPPGFTHGFSCDELRHVFLHELGHVKRHDILLGWVMAFLQILHWFNPLVWLAFARMRVDRELACDALALSHAEDQENKPYGLTIVKLLEGFSDSVRVPSLAGIVEDKQQMKTRISMIAKFQKTNRGTVLAAILVIVLGLLTLTDAQPGDGKEAGETKTTEAGKSEYLQQQLQMAAAGNKWAAFNLWDSYYHGQNGIKPDPAQAKKWLLEFVQDVWVVRFEPVDGFTPATPEEFLERIERDASTYSGQTNIGENGFFRTTKRGGKLVGSFLSNYPDRLKAKLAKVQGLKVTAVEQITPEKFIKYEQSAQESLSPAAASGDAAAPPTIVATSPAVGATEVDPALTEITVTFNQDMGGGFSWTGGGPEYPPTRKDSKIQWRDKRTCVLPVNLEAGHYYRVGINSTSHQNFRSATGAAALPSAIFFTTQGASEDLKAMTRVPQVVHFDPDNGAQNISPTVTELRVTFTVPMGGGCSWCTAGDDDHDFPKGVEGKQSYWTEDKKICVLPVELKPGMTYRLSLNAPEYKNFQSEADVPLEPVQYTFKTSGKEKLAPQPVKIGEPDASKGVWVVRFEPVGDFAPRTPGEFLERANQSGAYSGQKGEIGYFRTKKQGDKLVASFLAYEPGQLKAALDTVPGLKVTSVEKLTQEQLLDYEKSPQESLINLDELDASKGVWVVRFEPVGDFAPRTPGEFLERTHQSGAYSGQKGEIGYFRTKKQGDKLVASFLAYDSDQLKAALDTVPGLKVTSVEKLTQEQLLDYEKSPQESL